jgi:hypothetical protein
MSWRYRRLTRRAVCFLDAFEAGTTSGIQHATADLHRPSYERCSPSAR